MIKFGITLGGGGARGLAHIGVLEALEENGLRPAFVSGTSIGALIGALYCLEGTARNLHSRASNVIQSKNFKKFGLNRFYPTRRNILSQFNREFFEMMYIGRLLYRRSYYKIEVVQGLFRNIFGTRTFDDLKIRFCCNALDLQSGEEVVFKSGLLADAVQASCSIPGIFPVYEKDNRIFVDGSVANSIPVTAVKNLGAKVVVAVYLTEGKMFGSRIDTGYHILQRSFSIMKYRLDQNNLSGADLVIKPAVANFHWADFSNIDDLIQKGREALLANLDEIKHKVSFFYYLRRLLGVK